MMQEGSFISGSLRLHRATFVPQQSPWARLLILHGYGDHGGRYAHVLQWLSDRGVLGYSFDFRGQGRSEGRRGFVRRWEEYVDDLAAFLHLPDVVERTEPLFLLGHSHGGLIAAFAGIEQRLSGLRGCVLSAPFLGLRLHVPLAKRWLAKIGNLIAPALHVGSGLTSDMMTHDEQMRIDTENDPLLDHIGTPRWFVTMQAIQKQVDDRAPDFALPLLCLMAGDDPIADNRQTQRFFDRAGSTDRTLKTYAHFRHEILREQQREIVFNDILNWLRGHA